MKKSSVVRFAARVALGYVVIAAAWIAASDWLLRAWAMDGRMRAWVETGKGWVFVLVTGVLLFVLMRRSIARLQAEAGAREATQSALQESEERFRFVVENIREVFWIAEPGDSLRRVLYVSPNYETDWGFSRERLLNEPGVWLDHIHPDDRESLLEAVKTKQVLGTYDEQFRVVRSDGAVRWVRDRAFPVRGSDGTIRRIVGMAEDITERKSLEEQFLRAQRMEAVGTLAGGIAHDLNNILAPMLMAAGLLKEKI
ncbi:MAG TPA: PAS domain-containing protein, partial [Opitutus sp.]|nr:PAS domain-containing protein [Opitutus sp.]